MIIRNRELSQFGSFIYVENSTQEIGITTGPLPFVGIGTTNPQKKLHVVGDIQIEGNLLYNGELEFGNSDLNTTGIITAGAFFNSLGQELTAFDSWSQTGSNIYRTIGNVGIGSTVPSQKLDVSANIQASTFISTVSTGTPPFTVNSATQVGLLNATYLSDGIAGGTLPGDIVTNSATQTLTNKTLTSPQITTIINGGNLTLPTTTGTLVSTGSVGVITSGMISDLSITNSDISTTAGITYGKLSLTGSIVNADIASGAAIAVSKLASFTISGVSLGSTLNTLTFGSYLTGSSYNGSTATTIAVDATPSATSGKIVARDAGGGFSAGNINVVNIAASGTLSAGTFSITNLTATNGSFSGIVTATNGSFSGIVTATNGSFSGIVTAKDFNSTSDLNLKTNIHTVENALKTISNLRGVTFDWKENGSGSYGVIAQELQSVLPELVNDGTIKSVNYNGIIAVLIESIKELKLEVDELKKVINK
jgi:hypothetical protein